MIIRFKGGRAVGKTLSTIRVAKELVLPSDVTMVTNNPEYFKEHFGKVISYTEFRTEVHESYDRPKYKLLILDDMSLVHKREIEVYLKAVDFDVLIVNYLENTHSNYLTVDILHSINSI